MAVAYSLVVAASFLILLCFYEVEATYDNVRCKCVCPKEKGSNTSNVVIKNVEAEMCKCEFVVGREENFCLRCECLYESRNTLLIKVIVISVLVCIGALLCYMTCLMIYGRRHPTPLSVTSDELQEELKAPVERRTRGLTIDTIDSKMTRWKNKVSEQRQNVYRAHTMLN